MARAFARRLAAGAVVLTALLFGCGGEDGYRLTNHPGGPPPPPPPHHEVEARGSIVNTVYNTWKDGSGHWQSTMGPLSGDRNNGMVCDHVDHKFRDGDYAMWFVAPSDAEAFGLTPCSKNSNGEPTCRESYHECGQMVRITCEDPQWCANAGGAPSIYADMVAGKWPTNNYIPQVYVDMLRNKYGNHPPTPRTIDLYITDFCPRQHSANQRSGNCQGPQVDISTAAFLLLGRRNPQGYINSGVHYKVEFLHHALHHPGPR